MKSTQPLRVLSNEPTKDEIYREIEFLHRTLNQRMVESTVEDLEEGYTAGDLGSAANIAVAFNLTNAAINEILAILRKE